MLVELKVDNYKVFNKKAHLTLNSYQGKNNWGVKPNKSRLMPKEHGFNHILPLKSVFVYGEAGSGKTTLLQSLLLMRKLLFSSTSHQPELIKRHMFNSESRRTRSLFDVTFLFDDILYTYGFEVLYGVVVEEWLLTRTSMQKESREVFFRQHNVVEFGESIGMTSRSVDAGTLVLSHYWNDEDSWYELSVHNVRQWFFEVKTPLSVDDIVKEISNDPQWESKHSEFDNLMSNCGLRRRVILDSGQVFVERVVSDYGKKVTTNIKNESNGTQYLFCLLYNLFCRKSSVLLYDDIDTKIHPNVMKKVVDDINSPTNRNQVIATTNAHYLIHAETLHPDQVWFIGKNRILKTELYSLLEFGKIGNLKNWSLGYLHGLFGGVPFITNVVYDK